MEEQIIALLEEKFEEEEYLDYYLVELKTNLTNKRVEVFLESDSGVTINKCARINRYLQKHIDEAGWLGEKYVLDVSSPGVGKPLQLIRQYHRNVGRTIEVTLKDGSKKTGILKSVKEEEVVIEYKEKRKEAKKKKTVTVVDSIPFEDIEKTVVKIVF